MTDLPHAAGRDACPEPSPGDLYGDLLAAVQQGRVFEDGKTFVDCTPRRAVADIMTAYRRACERGASLADFVLDNFIPPLPAEVPVADPGPNLRQHIATVWPRLVRAPQPSGVDTSFVALHRPYLVPGGRFTELYYWDSYFSMLGLIRDGQVDLAEDLIDNFTALIERYGFIPNGTRTYYLSRSQPPLYAAMVALLPAADPLVRQRRLTAMIHEHHFWMQGAERIDIGGAARRVVRLADGALLNRYWDDRTTPRDESFAEDVETASQAPDRHACEVFRDLRAAAESGWDFSSRWMGERGGLPSICTTRIVPVDLNAYLYLLERQIARTAASLHDRRADTYDRKANSRRSAMHRHLWSSEIGCFVDYDLIEARARRMITAATLAPLFVGAATRDQARSVARISAARLLAPGGLRTTLITSGEQWDAPNGWAPLQWIAFEGLWRYGFHKLAAEIGMRWCETVDREFRASGWLHEKYDVEHSTAGAGGEYTPQHGFGWTNGVTASLLDAFAPSRLNL